MTDDLVARAQTGDGGAFQELSEPYRREIHLHCYRMLGSYQDAEDALQDTLLSAWQGFAKFEGRASIRTWLYRIATNRCLNRLRSNKRRSAMEWQAGGIVPPEPNGLGEIVWLEPYPDALLAGAIGAPLGPEACYERNEAVSLAFVTSLQYLPARQRAVLILREVLGYRAAEVAAMLDSTVESVTSALKRARATLHERTLGDGEPAPSGALNTPAEHALAATFMRAYAAGDMDALVSLLTEDVLLSMPPIPYEYHGRDAVGRFYASMASQGRAFDVVPTRANGQPAVGMYLRGPDGIRHGAGLLVFTIRGEHICALTRFEKRVLPWFGLPATLPDD